MNCTSSSWTETLTLTVELVELVSIMTVLMKNHWLPLSYPWDSPVIHRKPEQDCRDLIEKAATDILLADLL